MAAKRGEKLNMWLGVWHKSNSLSSLSSAAAICCSPSLKIDIYEVKIGLAGLYYELISFPLESYFTCPRVIKPLTLTLCPLSFRNSLPYQLRNPTLPLLTSSS